MTRLREALAVSTLPVTHFYQQIVSANTVLGLMNNTAVRKRTGTDLSTEREM